jgi:hypothetical protein
MEQPMTEHLIAAAESHEAHAASIRRDAIYADGAAHSQDMDRAAALDSHAATLRRAALPINVRCRPVLMVPVRSRSAWAASYESSIKREEARGDAPKADLFRAMRDQYARSNPGAFADHVHWEAR